MSALAAQECHEGNSFLLCRTYDILCGFILVVLKWLLYLQASDCPPKQEERDRSKILAILWEGKPFPWDFMYNWLKGAKWLEEDLKQYWIIQSTAIILLHTLVNLIFILSRNIFGSRDVGILSYLKLISEISHKAEV